MKEARPVTEKISCYHCGDECSEIIHFDEKEFCCEGCRLVYDILKENNLCTYYDIQSKPGTSKQAAVHREKFAFLDDEKIKRQLIRFTDGKRTTVVFFIPQIHCSSCIWLLENLARINPAIIQSVTNFSRKEVSISFTNELSLRNLVELLASIGYEPVIHLGDTEKKNEIRQRTSFYKIGIAGFCFGNIMLFSFPEYFSSGHYTETGFRGVFSYLNFFLSLPVFFYCSAQFFRSALLSLKQKYLNIDVPIALGILVMFVRSAYEIISATGAGYMDTMAGLVFFMLVGRSFQNKTYETISFERDYKSFFPVAVMTRKQNKETSVPVSDLEINDRITIRNEELIPADSVLVKGEANIDYSFVTGESSPVYRRAGDLIYAGGKQKGTAIELELVKKVSQSYLTQLWNSNAYHAKKDESRFQQLVNRISHYFTMALIGVALASMAGWIIAGNAGRGMDAFTAVLIIACPCALAISSPFTLGNILRVFGRHRFYLKNFTVIEKLAKVNTIVFDKTGTLTRTNCSSITFEGAPLSEDEKKMVKSLANQSTHPLSRMLADHFENIPVTEVKAFKEKTGEGISGLVFDVQLKIGSSDFTGTGRNDDVQSTRIYLSIDEKLRGCFLVQNEYRPGITEMIGQLRKRNFHFAVLSGDHAGELPVLRKIFGKDSELRFNQSPEDKLRFIQHLQKEGAQVLMIGDGLNDAGALKQSHVGVSITEDIHSFSPACDGILHADNFTLLPSLLKVSKASHSIILASFIIALLYNLIGLSFAVAGNLSPVVAAILMPISAITIISFTTGSSNWIAGRCLRNDEYQFP